LAWLLAQKPWIVPIPGTTQMSHLMDNIGGENVKLSSTEWKAFNEELNTIQVFGERFTFCTSYFRREAPLKKIKFK
jgi:aryl-alcohol dehydrogenase-like predicted oxidoreductase